MKKALLTSLSVIITGLILFFLLQQTTLFRKETAHIAVMAPLTGRGKFVGKEMIKGVNLYLDKINKQGGIEGRNVELLVYDDKADRRVAMKVAYQMASENKALIVLGHFTSGVSTATGKIYKKNGIPAITASATAETITLDNEWYFSIVPNNKFQTSFIANYVDKSLKKTWASIIFDKDAYGASLAENFEKAAHKLGIEIRHKWGFDIGENLDADLKEIIKEIRATDDLGVLFFGTNSAEAARIITSIKYPGTDYTIIGCDGFSGRSFLKQFAAYPQERSSPGYYTDGIYATSPFLSDIANEEGYAFEQEFVKKYNEKPSWAAACYYDAMNIAVESIRLAEIEGRGHIRGDRRKIRETLASFYSYDTAIKGASGQIYFDLNGDVSRPPVMGIYERHVFRPSFSQYHLTNDKDIDNTLEKALKGELIEIEGNVMNKTHIVYVGMDINEVRNLDIRNSSYTLDFYLWFRHKEAFDDADIKFTNALKPIRLGRPIAETTRNGIITRAYHLIADFKSDFDFRAYPFEHHTLHIGLRHASLTRDKLIFVTDVLGIPNAVKKTNVGTTKLDAVTGWSITKISFYQDIMSNVSSLGDPVFFDSQNMISHSRFNAAVRIERSGPGFAFKILLPIIVMTVILYLMLFIQSARLDTRILISMTILMTNTYYHVSLLSDLPVEYLSVIAYAFMSVYIFIAIAVFISISGYVLHKKGDAKKMRCFDRAGRILYPFVVLASVSSIYYSHSF